MNRDVIDLLTHFLEGLLKFHSSLSSKSPLGASANPTNPAAILCNSKFS